MPPKVPNIKLEKKVSPLERYLEAITDHKSEIFTDLKLANSPSINKFLKDHFNLQKNIPDNLIAGIIAELIKNKTIIPIYTTGLHSPRKVSGYKLV